MMASNKVIRVTMCATQRSLDGMNEDEATAHGEVLVDVGCREGRMDDGIEWVSLAELPDGVEPTGY